MLVDYFQRLIWPRLRTFGFWGIVDQVALAGSGFLITIAVARTGGPDALGAFALVQGGVLLLSGLSRSAFGDPLVIQVHNTTEDDLRCVTPLLVLHLILGIVLAVCALLLGQYNHESMRSAQTVALALLLPMAAFHELARSFRLAGMSERHLFLGDALVAGVRVASLALFFLGVSGARLGLWALVLGGIASLLTVRQYLAPSLNISTLRRLWGLGRWFVTESLLFGIGQYGIWFVAVPAAGVAVAGEVRAAQQLFGPVLIIQVGFATLMLARLSQSQGRFRGDAIPLAIVQLAFPVIWGALMIIFGPWLARILFGRNFLFSRFEILLMALTILVGAAYSLLTLALRAGGRGRRLILARVAAVLVTLCGIVLASRSFTGIVISLLVGQLAGLLVAFRRSADLGAGDYETRRGALRFLGTLGALTAK